MKRQRDTIGKFVLEKGKPKCFICNKQISYGHKTCIVHRPTPVSLTGNKNPKWKGGKSRCEICDKLLSTYKGKRCHKHRVFKNPEKWKENISKAQIGKKLSAEQKEKALLNIRDYAFKSGKEHPNWKGGITELRNKHAVSDKRYKFWRNSVFERDNYTCQDCKIKGGKLEAHHIKEWVNYPELRFEVLNGQTLCKGCHNKTKNPNKWIKRKEKSNADKRQGDY